MSKQKTSTDLLIQAVYQQSRENLRKCASKNFICSTNIPPSENTHNKESTKDHYSAATREVDKGVVDSVGDALFIDDDIPPIFAESGIFDKAE